MSQTWRLRARTAEAALELIRARLLVARVPFARWRDQLGATADPYPGDDNRISEDDLAEARRLARHVDRAATRLPGESKCLARAMALGRMLRRRAISHTLVIAARPGAARGGDDDLHAWIEASGLILLGNLPGPWARLLTLHSGYKGRLNA